MQSSIDQILVKGNAALNAGNWQDAERAYQAILQSQPKHPDANHNLGLIAMSLNQIGAALPLFKTALDVSPSVEMFWMSYIDALVKNNQVKDAKRAIKKAKMRGFTVKKLKALLSQIQPHGDSAEPSQQQVSNLLEHYQAGRLDYAEKLAVSVTQEFPQHPFGWKVLGAVLGQTGRKSEAVEAKEKAVKFAPKDAKAQFNLGNSLKALGRLDEARASYTQAIALSPDFAEAHSNLGSTLREQGKFDKAVASYRRAIALKPNFAEARSNLLFLSASVRFDGNGYLKEAQGFADLVAKQISSPYSTWCDSKSPTKLRVGFVSGDFKKHPVGYFLEGLLVQLQSSSIELYAYPTNNPVGEITDRLKVLFHSWKSLADKSDRDAAQTIHNDGVHILIDLSGHTRGNRLAIFGWRPAPIQVTWLGYFASTGLPEIDYILGDPFVTPQTEAHHFTEQIWQLPESYLCFTPPGQDLEVGPLPALNNGFLTFGCFNQLQKMTDEVVSVRADILHAVPNSKLFLKDKQLDYQSGRDRILSRFASFDISEDRLILEGKSKREEYLACYHRLDISLAPFPYGGGTTSVEGLWMGVPVITRKGTYFLSHLGESIAHNSNLSDWIAEDNEDYIAKAIEFSSDLSALEMLRQSLRENLLKTPLFDLPRFANNFEKALWEMRDSIND